MLLKSITKKLLSGMLSISLLLSYPVRALTSEDGTCTAEVEDCEELLLAANKAIQKQGELISLQADQIEHLRFNYDEVKQALEQREAWYKQPELIVPATVLITIFAVNRVR